MMKYLPILLLICLSTYKVTAQQSPCLFDELINNESLLDAERQIQQGVQKMMAASRTEDSIKVIPVVVHVIHNGGAENISEAQIQSQIRVINEDFGKLADTNGDGAGVDTKVRFFLANLDPQGRCTNGIVRIKSPLANHQTYQRALLKELSFWDNTRYMNIYVVRNISGNVAGYSSFPGGPTDEDGMVVQHTFFGNTGTAANYLGRTTTHEIGHWFGLYHTFNNFCGDDVCSDGDYVCDTPPAASPNFNCTTRNTCDNDDPDLDDQKENYMDYTPGSCKNMLTNGQKRRIQATLDEIRTEIWTEENLLSTGYDSIYVVPDTCPVTSNFVGLTREICFGNSIDFMDISLNNATEWQWQFQGGTPASSTEQNPRIVYDSIGLYDVTLIASDGVTTDTFTVENYINVGSPGIGDNLAYSEQFDEGLYPPSGITINNPDGGITWELDSLASTSGRYSIRINNLINTNYGTVDEIILPYLNFSSASQDSLLYMKFKWAYAKSDPSFSDELLVLLSTDCGTTFNQVFRRSGNPLATGPTQTTSFVPDSTQWKEAFVLLNTYKSRSYVQVKIVNVTDGGNNLYIDDLYIGNGSELVATRAIFEESSQLNVYPNPVVNQLNVAVNLKKKENLSLNLLNTQGVLIDKIPAQYYPAGAQIIQLSTSDIAAGIYFLVLEAEGYQKAIKIIIQK